MIEIGDGRKNPKNVVEILKKKDRKLAGYTAPAQGLMLMRVEYGKMGRI